MLGRSEAYGRGAGTDQSAPACRCSLMSVTRPTPAAGCDGAHLGEKVVREKEYRSAMTSVQLWDIFWTVRLAEARFRGCVVEGRRALAEGVVSWTFVMLGAPGTSRLARSRAPREQSRQGWQARLAMEHLPVSHSATGGMALGPQIPRLAHAGGRLGCPRRNAPLKLSRSFAKLYLPTLPVPSTTSRSHQFSASSYTRLFEAQVIPSDRLALLLQ